jgi:hypothetical protein
VITLMRHVGSEQIDVMSTCQAGIELPGGNFMDQRVSSFAALVAFTTLMPTNVGAQDVPGIEICTVEKTMERRTSCLQSNVDFLQKTITKLTADHQQKLDAANRQIDGLKASVIGLQKLVDDLQAAQKKTADDLKKKADAPPAKDAPAAAKDAAK